MGRSVEAGAAIVHGALQVQAREVVDGTLAGRGNGGLSGVPVGLGGHAAQERRDETAPTLPAAVAGDDVYAPAVDALLASLPTASAGAGGTALVVAVADQARAQGGRGAAPAARVRGPLGRFLRADGTEGPVRPNHAIRGPGGRFVAAPAAVANATADAPRLRGPLGRFLKADGSESSARPNHAVRGPGGRFVAAAPAVDAVPQPRLRGSHGRFLCKDGSERPARPNHAVRGPGGRFVKAAEPASAAVAAPAIDVVAVQSIDDFAARAAAPVAGCANLAPIGPVTGGDGQPKRTSRGTWAEKPVQLLDLDPSLRLAVWQSLADDFARRGIVFGCAEDLVSPRRGSALVERPVGPLGDLTGSPLAAVFGGEAAGGSKSVKGAKAAKATRGGDKACAAPADNAGLPTAGTRPMTAPAKKVRLAEIAREDDVRAGSDPVAIYLNEIGRYPRLSRAEENALSMRSLDANGSEADRRDAQETLVKCNLRLAVSIAKDFTRGTLPLMDLVSVANEGLIVASQKFDWRMGTPFANYASYWIKQRALKYVAEQGFSVRVPPHRAGLVNQVVRTNARLMQIHGRRPTSLEVMEELNRHLAVAQDSELDGLEAEEGVEPNRKRGRKQRKAVALGDVEEVMKMLQAPLELDAPLSTEGDAATFGTWFGETREEAAAQLDDRLEAMDMQNAVRKALGALPTREAQVIAAHFGLDGQRPRDLEIIAKELGVTRERARQIKQQALKRLQECPALLAVMAP